MLLFIGQRLAILLVTLLVASLVVFGVMRDPAGRRGETMLGPTATPETVAALAHKLGLDQPVALRYGPGSTARCRRSRPSPTPTIRRSRR